MKPPRVALLLSLLSRALGQVYNGQYAQGVRLLHGLLPARSTSSREGHPLPVRLFLPFVIFSNMIDAYRSAARINLRADEPEPRKRTRANRRPGASASP